MKNLFDRMEIGSQHSIGKAEKKRINSLVENALDLKSEYKVCHVSNKIKLVKDGEKFVYFEYYGKLCPTIHTFDRKIFKCVALDSGAVVPLSRGADVMSPGIIKYKDLCDKFAVDEVVGVEIIGQGIFAIGITLMSYDEMLAKNEGPVINVLHIKGDKLDLGTM